MSGVRVVVANGDARIELEGDAAFVERKLQELLPLMKAAEGPPEPRSAGATEDGRSRGGRQTLKTFIKAKAPGNVYEAIAGVLLYKRQHETKDELTGNEIRNALIQGGYRPPEVLPQALSDCRRKYGYIEVGSKRGLWKITHQGETLVEFDLPRKAKD